MIDELDDASENGSSTATATKASKKVISGPGLTAPGVVILQFLLILLVEAAEYNATKIGLFTGIAILISVGGAIYLGRHGSEFAAAVNPPLALVIATFINLAVFSGDGLHIARLSLAFVTALAAVAPYLIAGAIISWGYYLTHRK